MLHLIYKFLSYSKIFFILNLDKVQWEIWSSLGQWLPVPKMHAHPVGPLSDLPNPCGCLKYLGGSPVTLGASLGKWAELWVSVFPAGSSLISRMPRTTNAAATHIIREGSNKFLQEKLYASSYQLSLVSIHLGLIILICVLVIVAHRIIVL